MLLDGSGNKIEANPADSTKHPEVLKKEGQVIADKKQELPPMPYFAVKVETYTDSARRQVIQRTLVDGTPPADFYEFQGIGNYQFVIPDTNPPTPSAWPFPFRIPAKDIKEAYANFDSAMNAKEAMELAYMAFKTECQLQRAEWDAKQKAREMIELKHKKAQVEASIPNKSKHRRN